MNRILQVVSVAMIHGGSAFNVIPDSATIAGTFRAFSKTSFYALRDRIEEVTILSQYIKKGTTLIRFPSCKLIKFI